MLTCTAYLNFQTAATVKFGVHFIALRSAQLSDARDETRRQTQIMLQTRCLSQPDLWQKRLVLPSSHDQGRMNAKLRVSKPILACGEHSVTSLLQKAYATLYGALQFRAIMQRQREIEEGCVKLDVAEACACGRDVTKCSTFGSSTIDHM